MFDVLIREAGVRFGLGEKALSFVQMLLACMTDPEDGGLPGFLGKFNAAGLGVVAQSWLGGSPAAKPITNTQLEGVLGTGDGLLGLLTSRLDVSRDSATSALGYLLPPIVGMLTPGGNLPSTPLPAAVAEMAAAGARLLAAPAPAASGGLMKWLPWIVVVILVVLGLIYWANQHEGENAPAAAPPASAPASAVAPAADAASQPSSAQASAPAVAASAPASS